MSLLTELPWLGLVENNKPLCILYLTNVRGTEAHLWTDDDAVHSIFSNLGVGELSIQSWYPGISPVKEKQEGHEILDQSGYLTCKRKTRGS